MYPYLTFNQKVLGFHWFQELKVNDVVVITHKKKLIIKRIMKVNKTDLWVEGDNKNESTDSRLFGWINTSKVVAKVMYKL